MYSRVDSVTDVCHVQAQLDRMCAWSETWGLKLDPAKCKILTLSLKRNPIIGTYLINGVALERVHVMRDLGVMLDQKLTFAEPCRLYGT